MKPLILLVAICLAAPLLSSPARGDTGQPPLVPLAPGYGELGYTLPAPGTYRLPPLGPAHDGAILKPDGEPGRLADFFGDKYVLLSFIYSTCSDVNGCPLATAVLARVKKVLDEDPAIGDNLRLISLSFDPEHDTPEVMRLYSSSFASGRSEWEFLTTDSRQAIEPILKAYRQSVLPQYDDKGNTTGSFSHILRVFLIDRQQQIRNIYSVSFLHPDILLDDVRTLLLEDQGATAAAASVDGGAAQEIAAAPGDFKGGYDSGDYRTASRSLDRRNGEQADLLGLLHNPPLGLPAVPVPAGNPVTGAKIVLGRKLFFDRRLSRNGTISCAMCHIPEQGYTSNEMALAVGMEGRTVRRNAPTLYNVAYLQRLFHDGREYSLEHQVWSPLLAHNMMDNPSFAAVIGKLRHLSDYDGLFEAAFDGAGPGMETIGKALASYERTLLSADSPFDRWYYGKDQQAVSETVKRGYALFTGKAGCAACHRVDDKHALFTDSAMHNTGLGWYNAMEKPAGKTRVQVSPGIYLDVETSIIDSVRGEKPGDVGLYEVTQNPADRWRYRTASLRNIALTAPYMHDGSLDTLRAVVEFYNRGGYPNEVLDPLIRPLNLSETEIDDLVAFLKSLTGDNVRALVSDAFSAPVGDPGAVEPDGARDKRGVSQ
ncbi:MAG: SCO family protein [Thiogranum sp.]|jgi:cytochrome c peroxidase|nr:SCO family protein [Thiogranum sp.]